eukprot:CAMPEP_0195128666 /NCGR_PEP_ID=MMETSP0448-20130528/139665_1 /TAXON_ID=66468 /ORGANISM="Heterocapsa triquestra, Strain CCMP 448" /LENGTH=72 /DNA_ID=CAMNT_0040166477 /DNA_START=90 /DNA_END=305 /DNA_ORIENTATION=-
MSWMPQREKSCLFCSSRGELQSTTTCEALFSGWFAGMKRRSARMSMVCSSSLKLSSSLTRYTLWRSSGHENC